MVWLRNRHRAWILKGFWTLNCFVFCNFTYIIYIELLFSCYLVSVEYPVCLITVCFKEMIQQIFGTNRKRSYFVLNVPYDGVIKLTHGFVFLFVNEPKFKHWTSWDESKWNALYQKNGLNLHSLQNHYNHIF